MKLKLVSIITALVMMLVLIPSPDALAYGGISFYPENGDYYIRNVNSGLLINAPSLAANTAVTQKTQNDSTNQKWTLTKVGGYYVVRPKGSTTLALAVSGTGNGNDVNIILRDIGSTVSETVTPSYALWDIRASFDGFHVFSAKSASSQLTTIRNASMADDANVTQSYNDIDYPASSWQFECLTKWTGNSYATLATGSDKPHIPTTGSMYADYYKKDYFEKDRADNAQTKNNTVLGEMSTAMRYAPSPEDLLIGRIDTQEDAERHTQQIDKAKHALEMLSDTQRRRYLLYRRNGLTMRQIADMESVVHSKIQKSIEAAEKKIKRFLTGS